MSEAVMHAVHYEVRSWEEAGEQLRDWDAVPATSRETGGIAEANYRHSIDRGEVVMFRRSDGWCIEVSAEALREHLDKRGLRSARAMKASAIVSDKVASIELGHAMFDQMETGNPLGARVWRV